jgi:hypothetical protein
LYRLAIPYIVAPTVPDKTGDEVMKKFVGWTMLMMGTAANALAIAAVPEIDGASAVAAVVLLSGGLLVLSARRRK